jgi:hypothetical protein
VLFFESLLVIGGSKAVHAQYDRADEFFRSLLKVWQGVSFTGRAATISF